MNNSIEFNVTDTNENTKLVSELMNKWFKLIHSEQNKIEKTPYVSNFNIKDNKINITITVDNEEQIKEIKNMFINEFELEKDIFDNNLIEYEKDE